MCMCGEGVCMWPVYMENKNVHSKTSMVLSEMQSPAGAVSNSLLTSDFK